ncbi:MAG: IS110 family transposase [Bdellovibrionaceae bacterium]|nr:IS110 family transposase [Pseudobdellovibrionaceae bacterium]
MKQIFYGIDFHKNTSTIYASFQDGTQAEKPITIKSDRLLEHFSNRKGIIAIEATGGSNDKALKLREQGHVVKIVETNQFKAIGINGKKTDYRDAEALTTVLRLNAVPEVHLRSLYARQLKSLLKSREAVVSTRTRFISHIRGTLREYGVVFPTGIENFWKFAGKGIAAIDCGYVKESLEMLLEQCRQLKEQEKKIEQHLKEYSKDDPRIGRLKSVRGVGDITAYTLVAVSDDVHRFGNAKQFASYLGLTPSVSSSADKTFMGSITKSGSEMARRCLIHGARSWLKTEDPHDKHWVWAKNLEKNKTKNKAIVALAHRMSRICYAILRDESQYNRNYKSKVEAVPSQAS